MPEVCSGIYSGIFSEGMKGGQTSSGREGAVEGGAELEDVIVVAEVKLDASRMPIPC